MVVEFHVPSRKFCSLFVAKLRSKNSWSDVPTSKLSVLNCVVLSVTVETFHLKEIHIHISILADMYFIGVFLSYLSNSVQFLAVYSLQ